MTVFEAGKHYLTRDGRSRGPIEPAGEGPFAWLTRIGDEPDLFYFADGTTDADRKGPNDLVAEDVMANLGVELDVAQEAVEKLTEATAPLMNDPPFEDTVRTGLKLGAGMVWAKGGRKDDNGKPRYDLIAPEMLDEIAKVLALGAAKYAPRNWEQGMSWGRVFSAMMRHAWAWWRGEENDPETGLSHLSHLACNAMFLLAYSKRGAGADDRWKGPSK